MRGTSPAASPRRGWWPLPTRSERWRRKSRPNSTCRGTTRIRMALIDDPAVEAIVIVSPDHTHRRARHRGGAAGQADVLREAAGALARRDRGDEGGDREVRHVLPDGIHAAVRCRLCRREEADRRRAHRHAAGLQIDVARSVQAEPRVRESQEQRRHADRHGHPRLRSRALVHGRREDAWRRSARRSPTPNS